MSYWKYVTEMNNPTSLLERLLNHLRISSTRKWLKIVLTKTGNEWGDVNIVGKT